MEDLDTPAFTIGALHVIVADHLPLGSEDDRALYTSAFAKWCAPAFACKRPAAVQRHALGGTLHTIERTLQTLAEAGAHGDREAFHRGIAPAVAALLSGGAVLSALDAVEGN